jgi:hypothetical protein
MHFLSLLRHVTSLVHLVLPDMMILITFSEEYNFQAPHYVIFSGLLLLHLS